MQIRISATLNYARATTADPLAGGHDVLREIVDTLDSLLVAKGYSPNRVCSDYVSGDSLSVEVC